MWTSSFVSKVVFEVSKKNSGKVFLYNSVALTQWQFDFHDKNELLLPILRYSFFFQSLTPLVQQNFYNDGNILQLHDQYSDH